MLSYIPVTPVRVYVLYCYIKFFINNGLVVITYYMR